MAMRVWGQGLGLRVQVVISILGVGFWLYPLGLEV